MKEKVFIFLVIFVITNPIIAQTFQQKRAIQTIKEEKNRLEEKLSSLQMALNNYEEPDTMFLFDRKKTLDSLIKIGELSIERLFAYQRQSDKLNQELCNKRSKIISLKKEKEEIFSQIIEIQNNILILDNYEKKIFEGQINEVINKDLPQEMTRAESKRRHRSNVIESEEIQIQREYLGLQKIMYGQVQTHPINGYLGLVAWNINDRDTTKRVLFKINNAIDEVSIACYPGQVVEHYLLPGFYKVEVFNGSQKLGEGEFSVGPQIKKWGEKNVHWFVFFNKRIINTPVYQ